MSYAQELRQSEFFKDPDVRVARVAARLAALPIVFDKTARRGTKHGIKDGFPLKELPPIEQGILQTIAKSVRQEGMLRNRFNRGYDPSPTSEAIRRYVEWHGVRNRGSSGNRSSRSDIGASFRQTQYIADNLERTARVRAHVAEIRSVAVKSVIASLVKEEPIGHEAAAWCGDAVVDLGLSVIDNEKRLAAVGDIQQVGRHIGEIGLYGFEYPESYESHVPLLVIVGAEQEQRALHWNELFRECLKVLGDRRSADEVDDDKTWPQQIRDIQHGEAYQ